MLSQSDHVLLSQTGPQTTMGTFLRQFWTPAILSEELPEADGAPVRVRLRGENLIAFRESSGKVGLVGEHCPHRGASLYFARNGEGGLRCWLHGWKFDIHGTCLDMPSEPAGSRFKEKIRHLSYPCIERNGAVWAYMGPRDSMPPLPNLEWLTVPASHTYCSKYLRRCNWLQGLEGDIDSAHLPFLHQTAIDRSTEMGGRSSSQWLLENPAPNYTLERIPSGMIYVAERQLDSSTIYWRVSQWFFPNFTTISSFAGDSPLYGHSWVPLDDENCWVYAFAYHPTRPLRSDEITAMRRGNALFNKVIPGTYLPVCNRDNDYAGPNAPQVKQPWIGVLDFQDQDTAATESMGPMYDRTKEHLGASDAAVISTRRRLIAEAKALAAGGPKVGANPEDYAYRSFCVKAPSNLSWREAVQDAIVARPDTYRHSD
jgi:phenylpropionate dioxygenase-like ring-hydroxylating dioxygenase large terminal subunit